MSSILKFFTTWIFILIIFFKYSKNIFNLKILTFVTLFVGLYFSFINPKKFFLQIDNKKYYFTGIEKFFIVDLFFHILTFIVIYILYENIPQNINLEINSLCLMLFYLSFFNLKEIYGINKNEIILVSILSIIIYYIIIR